MADERIMPLADKADDHAPYFALVLVPGRGQAAMSGRLAVVGLGPGGAELVTPAAAGGARRAPATSSATAPYLDRVPARAGQRRHASDNREELDARAAALALAAEGRRSPSSRAAIPACSPWRRRCARRSRRASRRGAASRSRSCPASRRCSPLPPASARRSAHDFCAISLSDNLKPWEVVERGSRPPPRAGFVIALYNPASQGAALAARRCAAPAAARHRAGSTPVIFGSRGRPAGRAHSRS